MVRLIMKKVCLIIGAGAGIGGNCAKVFSKNGYYAFMARRTDQEGLDKLVAEIKSKKGEAEGMLFNIVEDNAVEKLVEHVQKNVGQIDTAIYNLGSQIGNRRLGDTSDKICFEHNSIKFWAKMAADAIMLYIACSCNTFSERGILERCVFFNAGLRMSC